MSTGGTPMRSTKGVARLRSQRGAAGQAATAPSRFPMTNERTVQTNSSDMVQGRDSMSSAHTVLGNLFSDTPRSSRATLEM